MVPHTHWDREWYAGFETFRARLVDVLSSALDLLERDQAIGHFMLDGQLAAVDDYLQVRPGDEGRIRALVGAGRLSIGPWYALMDEFLVSGETIVRNLRLGMRRAADFGGHQPVGYLPDMFGHVAQMPQLLRQAGLAHAVVWRGVPTAVDRSAFWWRSPDGTTVRAEYLPFGYSIGASLPDDPQALLRRLRAHEVQLAPFVRDGPMLIMAGTDHEAPASWLGAVVRAADSAQGDMSLRVVALAEHLAAAPSDRLPSWVGELRSGARANLLMGTVSNRVDLKQAAAIAERTLERLAEPLAALWLGADEWPAEALERAWLEMIRNSAHDSICGCSADEVCLAVLQRYADATTIGREVLDRVRRRAAEQLPAGSPSVLNPSSRPRGGLVELAVAGGAPAGTQLLSQLEAGTVHRDGTGADLGRLLAELTTDGWLDDGRPTSARVELTAEGVELRLVADRAAAADTSLRPIGPDMAEAAAQAAAHAERPLRVWVERPASALVLVRVADVAGYGWAPLRPATQPETLRGGRNWLDNGRVHVAVSSADGTFSIDGVAGLDRLVDGGDAGDTYNWSPPREDLVVERPDSVEVRLSEDGPLRGRLLVRRRFSWPSRLEGDRRSGSASVAVRTVVEVRAGEPFVRVCTELDNPCRDHRLRTLFPLPERAEHSVAECAFATVRRGLRAEGGPGEVGVASYPSRRFVTAGGLTLTHEGLCEYELVDDGRVLALTLLRATGVVSHPAPALRPNSAGPPLPTPGAQLVGPLRLRYAVAVGEVDPWALAEDAWLPLEVVHGRGTGKCPDRGSRLQVEGAQVSALRRDGAQLELRVFNPTDSGAVATVAGRSGWLVDLTGRPLERFDGSFPLPPWGIATALIDPSAAADSCVS